MVEIFATRSPACCSRRVSVLYREPMWLKYMDNRHAVDEVSVSVLYREPMWLKWRDPFRTERTDEVSVLYREPMWLKYINHLVDHASVPCFSALP